MFERVQPGGKKRPQLNSLAPDPLDLSHLDPDVWNSG